MTSSTSNPIDKFPFSEFTPLSATEDPTYFTIRLLQNQANANARSVESDLGDGTKGLLALVVSTEEYKKKSTVPFTAPTKPATKLTFSRTMKSGRDRDTAKEEHRKD